MSIPYGYYIAPNGHVAIDQGKANIVRMIYQQYLFGMSLFLRCKNVYFGLPMSHRASCLRICFENNPAFYIFLFRQKKRSNGGWLLRQILHNTRRLYRDEAPLK